MLAAILCSGTYQKRLCNAVHDDYTDLHMPLALIVSLGVV